MEPRVWHRHYDEGVPPCLDYEDTDLYALLERSARLYPEKIAIRFLGTSLCYGELLEDVEALAGGLSKLGVGSETAVAVHLPNLPQAVIAFFAVQRLGGRVVMTNPLYTASEVEHQWTDAGCHVAVVADYLFERSVKPARKAAGVEHVIVTSIPERLPWPLRWAARWKLSRQVPPLVARVPSGEGVHRFSEMLKEGGNLPVREPFGPEHPALLQYTGGTTGVSKGAVLTHGNLTANIQQLHAWLLEMEEGKEVVLTVLPLFHVFGLTCCMLSSVAMASTMVLMPDPRNTKAIIEGVMKEGVTIFNAVPTMFHAVTEYPGVEDLDLSSIKGCFSGSAPLPEETSRRFSDLTGATIIEGFGLTETSPVTHCNPYQGLKKIGSIGLPVSDTDARVVDVDDESKVKPPGEEGELLIRGPQVTAEYWNRPKETADSFSEDWFKTGDLAVMDDEGYFRIVGRKKDMIVAGGYNVYPDEVDNILVSHEGVFEACTIGIPDAHRGETVKSFVVRAPGSAVTEREIVTFCREHLAPYKAPKSVEFLDSLPRSSVMKVLRRELRELEIAKTTA